MAKFRVGIVALALFAVQAAPALAAPANDDFANRQVLSGLLPIEVDGSNVGATKEPGEPLSGFAPAGHSIWFEWEATDAGWVTIGACDGNFPAVLSIFTGTGVDELTSVVSGNASEGPTCPYSQRQYTFKAKEDTRYEIAVDGNSFRTPEAPAPVTEGAVELRIESTPRPPNDDFAAARILKGEIDEEPGGDRFYFASASGYNWTATTEPEEPTLGPSSGASVWYSWTAPAEGMYRLGGPCCGSGLHWAIYRGDSLAGLSPFLVSAESAEIWAGAGVTYRLVVYGTPDLATGEPSMASFGFVVSGSLSPLATGLPGTGSGSSVPPADRTAPQTTILKRLLKRKPPIAIFRFASSEPGSTFRCKLDKRKAAACTSPKAYSGLAPGAHHFKVYAVDAAGNADPTPATARIAIAPPQHRHR